MRLTILALALLPVLAEDNVRDVWPRDVDMPPGLRFYARSEYSQRLTITNDRDTLRIVRQDTDDVFTNAPTVLNPNRISPWKVSGGMDKVRGFQSKTALAIPKGQAIRYWSERVEAGAAHPLPRASWSFPVGTVAADLLSHDGKLFEVRTLTKTAKGWHSEIVWGSGVKVPGYTGPGRRCHECHDKVGSGGYGVRVRGSDGLFSFWPFGGATFTPRMDFPVKHWNE